MTARVLALMLAASVSACGTSARGDAPPPAPASLDAGTAAIDSGAPPSILPYPPGPYGAGIGDVMADFRVQGYALSRDQRDATKLPFRDVTIAEVRSDPECRCLLVTWTAAGHACQPCIDADQSLAAALVNDRSLCALEVIHFSFDTLQLGSAPQPPTRADLDAFVQANREPYPVGLLTASADAALTGNSFPAIPATFVVRASDMKIVAFIGGSTNVSFGDHARRLCAAPRPPVETVATGLEPRKLQVDAEGAFVSDQRGTVVRIDVTGATPPVELARPASPPDAIAIDAANVYWATHDGAPPYEIGAVARAGGPARTLATSDSGFTSLAREDEHLYFTQSNGAVGRAPTAGGPVETLFVGESGPTSIVTRDGVLTWIDTGTNDVIRALTDGSSRTIVAPFGSLRHGSRPVELQAGASGVFVRSRESSVWQEHISRVGDSGPELVTSMFSISAFGLEPATSNVVASNIDVQTGVGMLVATHIDPFGRAGAPEVVTPGQPGVGQIRTDGKDRLYWTTTTGVRRIVR